MLEFLDTIKEAKGARWDFVSANECLPGTRTHVLGSIVTWISHEAIRQVFWLNGMAGTGKTTIAKSVAHFAAINGQLGASFFCSRDSTDRSNVKLIFPTLAAQLSEIIPEFHAQLMKSIKKKGIGQALPSEQFETLIIEPLQTSSLHGHSIVIVIDALDECNGEVSSSTILEAFSIHINKAPFLKVIVTSRPEPALHYAFQEDSLQIRSTCFYLHDVELNRVNDDIRLFLRLRLREMAEDRRWTSSNWPPDQLVERLVQQASGLFIFASTLCKFVESTDDLEEQLEEIAQLTTSDNGYLGIDQLYQKVVNSAMANFSDEQGVRDCHSILGTIVLLQNPLSLTDLSQLLCLSEGHVTGLLKDFHSVLDIPQEGGGVRVIHASFPDFLTNEHRCSRFFVSPALQHRELTLCLFNRMVQGNICDIGGLKLSRGTEDCIDGSLVYACRYWADHLVWASRDGNNADQLVAALDEFVHAKLSYWIEILSFLESLDVAMTALHKANIWYSVS